MHPIKPTTYAKFWRRFDYLAALSAVLAIPFLAVQILRVDPAIFRIDARTDLVEVEFPQGSTLPWPSDWMTRPIPECAGAPLRVSEGSSATVARNPDGRVDILIEQPGDAPAATLDCTEAGDIPTPSRILLSVPSITGTIAGLSNPASASSPKAPELPKGRFLVLPFSGTLRVGGGMIEGKLSPPILRSARISVEMPASITGGGRTDIEHIVETGDTIEFIARDPQSGEAEPVPATMIGFLMFDEEPGVRVVARGKAINAKVIFHGAEQAAPGIIAPTLFGRLKASAEYIIIVPILWLLAAGLRALRRATDPAAATAPTPSDTPLAPTIAQKGPPSTTLAVAIGLGVALLLWPVAAFAQPDYAPQTPGPPAACPSNAADRHGEVTDPQALRNLALHDERAWR